jgi:hypothetical protein
MGSAPFSWLSAEILNTKRSSKPFLPIDNGKQKSKEGLLLSTIIQIIKTQDLTSLAC